MAPRTLGMFYFFNLLLLLLVLSGRNFAENVFVYPPNNGEVLRIPQGTSITIKWDSQFSHLNLRVFQARSGGFAYNTLLCMYMNMSYVGSRLIRNSYSQCCSGFGARKLRMVCCEFGWYRFYAF